MSTETPGRTARHPRPEVAVRETAELGEGPTWDPATGRLIWIDILSSRVHGYDPATGRRTVFTTGQHVGAVKPRAGGGLVLNLRDGVALLSPEGAFSWLHHDPVPNRRGNDAAVAPDGSLWAGTMTYDETPGGGSLTRIAPDGTAVEVLPDSTVSNGTGWSPDGRLMYYADSPTRRVDVFDVVGQDVRGRRTLAEIEDGAGYPDGLCVDADGCVWVALWDGGAIRRYTPDGRLDRTLPLPVRRPTACAFGGPDLTDLYITTARVGHRPHPLAGSLLVLPDAGQGLPQPPFAG
ncbi:MULTISPECIES: SMP-30/gluconolactonase/LRE family protein [Streptomyces]|uniref:SMP-30/gluconolactonase/LRE family protein n=2 Tax=Streptomyces TaxID=1883 RepID=A0A3R7IXS2_9ACTN|nr:MULTISPECIES: SMP-30/gluconolactonase/LRE family protein [Streptomyces]KNE81806.1 calcium-binding protein [Streptomyces fradiae]OFA59132.1 calcium-binding protein [Streptomyces fradiae]PQM24853.1 SMP-30/gluconolactonase/LRE family protein [Streptomyces xinghaiensis]RKM98905.1 SMP-30/gluconolactonase/LRE family protein [Streptomyces xinghaiensis]RNC76193.1 SMP-30/gluconolactonase/LRE family protein [Streptomyces xinghaiensis]